MKTGEVIGGRFELRQVLGEGGMGQVFKAWDTELERYVAIKTLLPQFMSDPGALEEMKQEVRISQRLNHPGIVAVYDYRVHDRTPYIIMEFVEGLPLHHYLFRQGTKRLDENAFLVLADLILTAVGYAHERGVIHRDLKPANIMVLPSGGVKLMDFGIAAAVKATYTRITGHTSGLTIQYSSPEQINGEPPSASMDIYALGCVFYEMLTGHPPFYLGEVLHQQLTRPAPPMPGVSAHLNAAVLGCLLKDPKRRFRSVGEIRGFLAGDRTIKLPRKGLPGGGMDTRLMPIADLLGLSDAAAGDSRPWLLRVRAFLQNLPPAVPVLAGGVGGLLVMITALLLVGRATGSTKEPMASVPPQTNDAAPVTKPAPTGTERRPPVEQVDDRRMPAPTPTSHEASPPRPPAPSRGGTATPPMETQVPSADVQGAIRLLIDNGQYRDIDGTLLFAKNRGTLSSRQADQVRQWAATQAVNHAKGSIADPESLKRACHDILQLDPKNAAARACVAGKDDPDEGSVTR